MKKNLYFTILALFVSFASFATTPIAGIMGVCVGSTTTLFDTLTSTGTWASSNPAIATISSTGGVVTGISAGTTNITYTDASGFATAVVTVAPVPAAITGTLSLCSGATSALSDATPGGYWSSTATWIATVGSATGVVTGGTYSGSTTISYTVVFGCSATAEVTVNTTSADSIEGPSTVCVGSTVSLSDAASGGVWTSSNPAVASISTGGVVAGVSAGTALITYAVSGTCGSGSAVILMTVTSGGTPATITGASSVNSGYSIWLSASVSGGTWSSSDPSIATVSSSGIVTGGAAGTATISYTTTGCAGALVATHVVTVNAYNGISGYINYGPSYYGGSTIVWLITYDSTTSMLTAVDSTVVDSGFYQFLGEPAGSYRIKAAPLGSASGYMPTYHTSSYYWYSATVLNHLATTNDIDQNITMLAGPSTSGPGFIGGSVLTGANKGTSGAIPVVGLNVYLVNSSTSEVVGITQTNASGNYSFSSLPVGATYFVFPDSLNYMTTPYSGIALTTASPSITTASFIEHTLSHTITPIATGVTVLHSSEGSVSVFPNPVNNKLNLAWYAPEAQAATVAITDVAGREVYSSTINMVQGSGAQAIDLSSFTNGLYLISVKGTSINYNSKIQVQH